MQVKNYNFVCCLAFMADVMPIINGLSKCFQADALNINEVSLTLIK